MDHNILQDKVQAFAQRLLQEAQGDPVRALGLLVLVLDGADVESAEHAQRLVAEVRQALIPSDSIQRGRPVQHLAGDVSWEGVQHCLRCARVLARHDHGQGAPFATGYVFEIGPRFTSEKFNEFDVCR
ncbi:MAG: hypothetical protein HP491_09285 [Nitrospira sp.]|nr:hypothetical protein [Nitrospira sp.]MBH0185946.1 hypothetical protein [Nitrospira sp.]